MVDLQDKVSGLVGAARYDACSARGKEDPARFIYHAALPGGGCMRLFKVLLTNFCVNDCAYCCNRSGLDIARYGFKPEELANVFMELYRRGVAQGVFLSSGIGVNASRTMTNMIDTVRILRYRLQYRDYIHLKILPGATRDCVEEACRLANRVSVNIEAPTAMHLARLTTRKDMYRGILEPMQWIRDFTAENERMVRSGQTTQFVVGASGETDRDILHATETLYGDIGLRRAYFSAFRSTGDPRLDEVPATPPIREHRLYQADWLIRVYGFLPWEVDLALEGDGDLPLKRDPKLAIALKQPWLYPLDINRAEYEQLLRVPGIGPVSARRIIETRDLRSIDSLQQLRRMRVMVKQAAPFIRFQGMLEHEKQLSLLPPQETGAEELSPEPGAAGTAETTRAGAT